MRKPPPEHCTNGETDAGESDVDCGGACAGCAYGKACASTDDCANGTCDDAVCRFGTWATVAPMPTPRRNLAAVLGPDGLIYAIGGSGSGGASSAVEAYDPVANSWTARAALPMPRYGLAAVVAGGLIYAIGGDYFSVSDEGKSIYVHAYNPTTNTWSAVANLPAGRYKPAAAVTSDGKVFVVGGFSSSAWQTLATALIYQPATGWTALTYPMTSVRSSHAAGEGRRRHDLRDQRL